MFFFRDCDRQYRQRQPWQRGHRQRDNPNVEPVDAPIEVTIFPLDSAGRPIDFGYVSSEDALAAGSSWTFTTTIRSPINNHVAFAVYGYAR